ncbi:hypothetical protein E2C01_042993 [Portunus trituberculatus]|uniref:Uncharacterized protein n=1 Tax=Portunus trituberculatus TaxID=210409 RepID=A0A5B7FUX0_PORTR|nr:hypothetical protein [Portunus trituberculatus]
MFPVISWATSSFIEAAPLPPVHHITTPLPPKKITTTAPLSPLFHSATIARQHIQWNHARFGLRGVSKRTGSNPVHGPSVGWDSSLGATVS